MQVGTVASYVEEPAFRFANEVAETEVLHKLIGNLRYGDGSQGDRDEENRYNRVKNVIRFHEDVTRKGPIVPSTV